MKDKSWATVDVLLLEESKSVDAWKMPQKMARMADRIELNSIIALLRPWIE